MVKIVEGGDFDSGEGINEKVLRLKTIKHENREDWLHITTHIMGILIIASFIVLCFTTLFIFKTISIPEYIIAIVSTVIGFYFGNAMRK